MQAVFLQNFAVRAEVLTADRGLGRKKRIGTTSRLARAEHLSKNPKKPAKSSLSRSASRKNRLTED